MRTWLVQQLGQATFGFWLPAELWRGDLYKFTDHAGEATASYTWENEPSSLGSVVLLTHRAGTSGLLQVTQKPS